MEIVWEDKINTKPLGIHNKEIRADDMNTLKASINNVYSGDGVIGGVKFNTDLLPLPYMAGQLSYNNILKCLVSDTGYPDVRTSIGREIHVEVYNSTALTLLNGSPVSTSGTGVGGTIEVIPSNVLDQVGTLGFVGLTTMDIPPGEKGIVTCQGIVNGIDTSSLSTGFIYLGTSGFTNERPLYPTLRVLVGGVLVSDEVNGSIYVCSQHIPRRSASRSATFSSADASSGVHYRAGFYDWSSTATTLTQSSQSVTHGTANITRAAHVGIVPSGPGTVDSGQVGIRVIGTMDNEEGVQVSSQTQVITDDITTLTLNDMTMVETVGKFSGTVTIELYVVSGTPTVYSLSFNYGYSKYTDFANQDGTVISFSAVWEAGAADSDMNITLLHHGPNNWIYSATGFEPGNGVICDRLTDQAINSNLAIGEEGSYKRTNLNKFIDGSGSQGVIIKIFTGANNSIRTMDMNISAFSEELT